jgi:translation elongation factor EF-G
MNKRFLIICTCSLLALTLYSQTSVNELYQSFARESNVDKVNLNEFAMFLMRPFSDTDTESKITSISVLSLEECSPDVKNRFNKSALDFNDDEYELFVSANDENEKVRIFLKFQKEIIREMVILTMGDNPALIQLKGKILPSEIESMSNGRK